MKQTSDSYPPSQSVSLTDSLHRPVAATLLLCWLPGGIFLHTDLLLASTCRLCSLHSPWGICIDHSQCTSLLLSMLYRDHHDEEPGHKNILDLPALDKYEASNQMYSFF